MPRTLTESEQARKAIDDFFKSGEWKQLKKKLKKLKLQPIKDPFVTLSASAGKKLLTHTVLDEILGRGGISAKKIVEVYGEYRTGKTQLVFTLVCEATQYGTVCYDDSEFTFAPERIIDICEARGLDVKKVKENLILCQPEDWREHLAYPSTIPSPMDLAKEGRPPLSLILVDSLIAPFDKAKDFMGQHRLALRSQMFRLFFADLRTLARMHDCPVFITNQVTVNLEKMINSPNPKYIPSWQKQKAKGGYTIEHIPDIILYLRMVGNKNVRLARLIDSSELPTGERQYVINEKGIDDVPLPPKKDKKGEIEEDEEE